MDKDFIVDPLDSSQAIHIASGRMAASVFVGPALKDVTAPSLSELQNFIHIGFASPEIGYE